MQNFPFKFSKKKEKKIMTYDPCSRPRLTYDRATHLGKGYCVRGYHTVWLINNHRIRIHFFTCLELGSSSACSQS